MADPTEKSDAMMPNPEVEMESLEQRLADLKVQKVMESIDLFSLSTEELI